MAQRGAVAVVLLALAGWVVFLSGSAAQDAKTPPKEAAPADIFGLTRVWSFHLEIPAKEYEAMQPSGGMRFPGAPGGPPPPPKPPEKPGEPARETHRSAFGMEFPIVKGSLTVEGTTFKDVGVRYKGNATYMGSSRSLKRSFKIDLDKFDADAPRFHGEKNITLNCGVMDPTKGREALAYSVFRAAGVPAPRTAFAEVTLTVPGKYDKEYLGIYTLIEDVDKTFLKEHFKNTKGLLLKPEGVRGIDYLGDDWSRYTGRYHPKRDAKKEEAQRVIDFARLVHGADDERFRKEIGSYLDIDEFLRFLAVNAFVVNADSFFSIGHNYYIYLNPETNKFVYIPWDLDLSLGAFPMAGSQDQQLDLSLTHPHGGENKLIDRLLAMKDVNEKYQKLLKELAGTCFAKEQLLKDVETIEKTVKEPIAKEAKAAAARKEGGGFGFGPPGGGGMFGRSLDLKTIVEKRTASVEAQIAGKSKGYVPAGFGFGGPGGRPGGFGMGNPLAKPLLEGLDTDKDGKLTKDELTAGLKKFFKDCDKDDRGSLDEKAIAEGLSRVLPPPPGGVRPPGPGGFGPGNFFAGAITRRADADKDGKVTLEELTAAADALFAEIDKDKKGKLEEKDIAAGFGLLFPPPPGFGPPPGPPPAPAEPKKEDKK